MAHVIFKKTGGGEIGVNSDRSITVEPNRNATSCKLIFARSPNGTPTDAVDVEGTLVDIIARLNGTES
jgi:hypothetical protein